MSVVVPAYNERPNLAELVPETVEVLSGAGVTFELIIVDDGSTDGTATLMRGLRSPEVRYLRMRRNGGKSAALSAGLSRVKGEFVVLMDADGQDDPHEIPRLLKMLEAGEEGGEGAVDLVTGRRADRQDRFIKKHTSKVYNWITNRVTGVSGRDFNSGLKAMRRELATSLQLYGELHRYIPVLAVWQGFTRRRGRRHPSRPPPRQVQVRQGPVLARLPRPHHRQVPHHVDRAGPSTSSAGWA